MKKYILIPLVFLLGNSYAQDALDSEVIPQESQIRLDVKSFSFGFHIGTLNYIGDIKGNGTNPYFGVGNWAFGVTGEKKFGTNYGVLVNGIFGNVSNREVYEGTFVNFKTSINHIDVNFMLDADNGKSIISPFLSVGLGLLLYNPKADLMSEGVTHYFWSDGSYRDVAQDDTSAISSVVLTPDYDYETKLEGGMALTLPIWLGVKFKISRNIDMKLATSYVLTFTDNIENISAGGNDKLFYTTFGVNYNLVGVDRSDKFRTIDFTTIFNADSDNDGIKDKNDMCQDTPEGVAVDQNGCALDGDKDGVPDYLDKEPTTAANAPVDENGVTLQELEEGEIPVINDQDIEIERKEFKSTNDNPK